MNIELTAAQQRKITSLLHRLAKGADIKTANIVRMISVEIVKSQRRAKRQARNYVELEIFEN